MRSLVGPWLKDCLVALLQPFGVGSRRAYAAVDVDTGRYYTRSLKGFLLLLSKHDERFNANWLLSDWQISDKIWDFNFKMVPQITFRCQLHQRKVRHIRES